MESSAKKFKVVQGLAKWLPNYFSEIGFPDSDQSFASLQFCFNFHFFYFLNARTICYALTHLRTCADTQIKSGTLIIDHDERKSNLIINSDFSLRQIPAYLYLYRYLLVSLSLPLSLSLSGIRQTLSNLSMCRNNPRGMVPIS